MPRLKLIGALLIIFFLATSCSYINKLKEKISSKDKDSKETTKDGDKEETVERTSAEDFAFYNKYIEVSNKLQTAGDGVYKSFTSDIPAPKSITKTSFIMSVSFGFAVGQLGSTVKEQKRSFYDGGDLSKLKADNTEMKNEVEDKFKNLLRVMENYKETAQPVADYYSTGRFKEDLSKVEDYDTQMKEGDDKYREAFRKFNETLKKYKPKKETRDLESISDPDEKAVATLLNAYENTLDLAEPFYEKFETYDANSKNQSELLAIVDDLEKGFAKEKERVLSAKFGDITKYYKYTFEDYFSMSVSSFVKEARTFLNDHKNGKLTKYDFNYKYDNVITYYNNLITAYNTNINVLNSYKPIKLP